MQVNFKVKQMESKCERFMLTEGYTTVSLPDGWSKDNRVERKDKYKTKLGIEDVCVCTNYTNIE